MAQYLGWGAIALLVIARFFFRKKTGYDSADAQGLKKNESAERAS